MQKFKVGQRIQLEGVITKVFEHAACDVLFDGASSEVECEPSVMQHAKIIAEPEPKFTKEQVAAIEKFVPRFDDRLDGSFVKNKSAKRFYEFLDANTE
jgi:hypothetical protein